jgi:hypothetical protein
MIDRVRRRVGRALGSGTSGVPPAPPARPAPKDAFAAYRSLDGPSIVPRPAVAADPDHGPPRVTVLMPTLALERMTGGPNTVLNLTARLARHGHRIRYVATFGPLDDDAGALRRHIAGLAGDDAAEAVTFEVAGPDRPLTVRRDDVLVATWWPTALLANDALAATDASGFVYVIQDFEPAFQPWSALYATSLSTYSMPIRAVVNESLLAEFLIRHGVGRFGDPAASESWRTFEPAIDPAVFAPRADGSARPRRLLFYARPKVERNAFDLGLRALRVAAAAGWLPADGWEVRAIGSVVPALPLGPSLDLEPVPWLGLAEYGRYLAESDVLLSLMVSPHTSYPPLEMAATGGRVVTNTFDVKTAERIRTISPRIDAVAPTVDALADAIRRAVEAVEADVAGARVGTTVDGVAMPSDWGASFEPVLPWLARSIEDLRAGRTP